MPRICYANHRKAKGRFVLLISKSLMFSEQAIIISEIKEKIVLTFNPDFCVLSGNHSLFVFYAKLPR